MQKTQKPKQEESLNLYKKITMETTTEIEIFVKASENNVGDKMTIPSQEFVNDAIEAYEDLVEDPENTPHNPTWDQVYLLICDQYVKGDYDDYAALPIQTNGTGTDVDGGFLELAGWKSIEEDENS